MKIALCTLSYGDTYKKMVKYGIRNKERYCKKYNYPLITDESVIDLSRRTQWGKIKLILKYIDQYDYLVWIDADTYITNDAITLESLVEKYNSESKYSLIYEKDPFIWVNSGFMIAKNTEYLKALLNECWNHLDQICDEQGSLDYLYRSNWNNAQNNILVLDHSCGLNQYWNSWQPNDFVIHFPGCHEPGLKPNALEIMMLRYCTEKIDGESDDTYQQRQLWLNDEVRYYNSSEWVECRKTYKALPRDVYLGN
jgi:hypothetical protein